MGSIFQLFKQSFQEWNADKSPRLAAALAYYTVFSLGPLLLVILAIIGFFLGNQAANGELFSQLKDFVGPSGAKVIENTVQNAHKPTSNLLSTIIGVITLILGASGVFGQLKDALNTIWHVEPRPGRGVRSIIIDRFLNISMLGVIAFLLLISLVASSVISGFSGFITHDLHLPVVLLQVLNFLISFVIVTLLFMFVLKVLPDVSVPWSKTWIGALFTSLLFTIGKTLIGLYIGRGAVGSAYGAAGSLIVILVWVYYSSMILFFGAEFTKVYVIAKGLLINPSKNAVFSDDLFIQKERAKKAKTQAQVTPLVGYFLAGAAVELASRLFGKGKKKKKK